MSSNAKSDALDTSATNLNISNSSNNDNQINIAPEFHRQLYSILNSKPPVSKDKVSQIVKEALKSYRNYKHVVYYIETFIKNCPSEYKLSGLYVIDALIRKQSSNSNSSSSKKQQSHIDLYVKRFSLNLCKTFTNLFLKSPQTDRVKINRVIELWQRYNIIDSDLVDKLNRISNTSKIDVVLSTSSEFNDQKNDLDAKNSDRFKAHEDISRTKDSKISNGELMNELQNLSSKINNDGHSAKKMRPSTPPVTITKNEISKILEFDNDFDSDSDNQSNLKRKSISPNSLETSNPTSIFQSNSERLKASISNCTAWLQTNSTPKKDVNVQLADFVHPSTLMHSYMFGSNLPLQTSQMPPPPPPPVPVPPPPNKEIKLNESKLTQKEKEKERHRRGLPYFKDQHICICSKTIWLGHLSKSTTEDLVIDEIIELLSPSSSNDSDSNTSKKKLSRNKNYQNIILDVHLIPPRGCAYVEFIDRKMASKCLDRMKDSYRLDGNYIKVAWATNKGIEKEKRLREFWNVDVGCTYIPWGHLDTYSNDSIDFSKWAIGGLVDEDSLPVKYLSIYKNQMIKLANSDNSISTKNTEVTPIKSDSNDMDLDTDEAQESPSLPNPSNQQPIQQIQFQNLLNPHQVLPINFNTPPPTTQISLPGNQFLSSNTGLSQNQIGISSLQVHPLNFSHLRQFNPVFSQTDTSQESLITPNQNLLDLLNSQRNIMTLPSFPGTPSHFQFIQRPLLMNTQGQTSISLSQQNVLPIRKILLPLQTLPSQNEESNGTKNSTETSEITSTTQNEDKNDRQSDDRNSKGNYQRNNWKQNNNYGSNRRSYGNGSNDTNRNNYSNNQRYSNRSNNYNNKNSNFRYNGNGKNTQNGNRS